MKILVCPSDLRIMKKKEETSGLLPFLLLLLMREVNLPLAFTETEDAEGCKKEKCDDAGAGPLRGGKKLALGFEVFAFGFCSLVSSFYCNLCDVFAHVRVYGNDFNHIEVGRDGFEIAIFGRCQQRQIDEQIAVDIIAHDAAYTVPARAAATGGYDCE